MPYDMYGRSFSFGSTNDYWGRQQYQQPQYQHQLQKEGARCDKKFKKDNQGTIDFKTLKDNFNFGWFSTGDFDNAFNAEKEYTEKGCYYSFQNDKKKKEKCKTLKETMDKKMKTAYKTASQKLKRKTQKRFDKLASSPSDERMDRVACALKALTDIYSSSTYCP